MVTEFGDKFSDEFVTKCTGEPSSQSDLDKVLKDLITEVRSMKNYFGADESGEPVGRLSVGGNGLGFTAQVSS